MGFQLVIAEGKEAGREFVFDQLSVLIGRTSECDVVLYDPGVSRKHARIFSEGPEYFAEDMGSSNGTKVNGSIIKKKQLADGDSISLGPVVFSFTAVTLEPESATDSGDNPPLEQHTRIVMAAEVKRSRNKGVAALPAGATAEQLKEVARTSTRTMQAVAKPRASSPGAASPIARAEKRTSSSGGGQMISAAEKARLKRQSGGALGGFKIFWAQAGKGTRAAVILATLAVVVGGGGGIAYALFDEKQVILGPEPESLSAKPVEDTFGVGTDLDPVKFNRSDQKVFDFTFTSPVKAVVVIHYQARDISAGEVIISVNSADVGQVPPDTMAVNERSNELVVASAILKKGETNKIVFDNTHNPPGNDTWRIWNIWVETALLPELPEDQLRIEAINKFKKGQEKWEQRDVGAPNRWDAYKSFREAWLMLEAHSEPKPPAHALSRERMKEAQMELDRQCSKLLLGAQSAYNQRQFDQARIQLDQVKEFFPEGKHPCVFRAEQVRDGWGL